MRTVPDVRPLAGSSQLGEADLDALLTLHSAKPSLAMTALPQQIIGQRLSAHLQPPVSICGKRSRSNSHSSTASDSSSSPSSYDGSVFSLDNEHADSHYDSQTSVENSPMSRKPSAGESVESYDSLTAWRASLKELDVARVCKKLKAVEPAEPTVAASLAPPVAAQQPAQPAAMAIATSLDAIKPLPATASVAEVKAGSSAHASSPSSVSSTGSSDGKSIFVDNLVHAAVRTLDAIWSASLTAGSTSCDLGEKQTGLPLQIFVRETLRRGRTSCSTLQAALLYCVRLKDVISSSKAVIASTTGVAPTDEAALKARESAKMLLCPRRMFLAAVMVASKFVQDRTYSNRAWCKISGLPVKELGRIERAFLAAIDYRLVVGESEWEQWVAELMQPAVVGAAPATSIATVSGRRASFARSRSDNVTGAAIPLDTELRAASPQIASQVNPKYRLVDSVSGSSPPGSSLPLSPPFGGAEAVAAGIASDLPLPYPMQLPQRDF